MASRTLLDELDARVRERGPRPALRRKRDGAWQATSWQQWRARSRAVAAGLVHRGFEPGARALVVAGNDLDWVVVDVGIWLAGGVSVPVHGSSAPELAALASGETKPSMLVADSAAQADRLLGIGRGPWRVVLGPAATAAAPARGSPAPSAASGSAVLSLGELEAEGERSLAASTATGAELERRRSALAEGDLATVLYSSGTSGEPKGVRLTHGNLLFEARALAGSVQLGPDDEQLLFLPLSHIFGRMLMAVQLCTGLCTSFAQSMVQVLDDMAEVNPTVFASVPRLFEKIHQVSQHAAAYHGPIRQRVIEWASHVGEAVARAEYEGRRVARATAVQHRYADRLVLSQVRRRFGRKLRFAISGGAPLSPELARWYYAAGVLLLEVYGLTECSGAATINRPERFAFGTVGEPLPGVEVRIADDGEVLIRGANVMPGYWQRPPATAAAIDQEGWLHTGDLGELREVQTGSRGAETGRQPMLHISGRSKDLIVTASGHNVAPERLERLLGSSPWISRAVVFGDRRPHLVALLALDVEAVSRWAAERRIAAAGDGAALCQHPEVRGLCETEIDLVNQRLGRHERIHAFALLDRDLSIEAGELTDTLKVKRLAVAERHRQAIDALYGADRVV